MDDLLLFTPSKQLHMRKLEDLLKALLKNGLKISARKCQLFRKELHYNTIFIQGKRVCVKPMQRNQVRDQLGSGQRKYTRKPQIEQRTNKNIEQNRENIPKHVYNPQEPKISIYPNPITKPPPKPPDKVIQDDRQIDLDLDLEINKDFQENSPYQEITISEIYQRPEKSQLVDPPELIDLVNTEKIVQKY